MRLKTRKVDGVAKAIIGEKLGMTQVFLETEVVPVTVLRAGPCVVTQLKDEGSDGYRAVQLGFDEIAEDRRSVNQPMRGHFARANCRPQRFLLEVPLDPGEYQPGQKVRVGDMFSEGDAADVTGISKGKGFAGVVKRWGFAGGPASHGARFHRAPGAIGQCADPARVFKGKKMPGHMGAQKVTALNLAVVKVDAEKNLLMLKGSIPGPRGSIVLIRDSVKAASRK